MSHSISNAHYDWYGGHWKDGEKIAHEMTVNFDQRGKLFVQMIKLRMCSPLAMPFVERPFGFRTVITFALGMTTISLNVSRTEKILEKLRYRVRSISHTEMEYLSFCRLHDQHPHDLGVQCAYLHHTKKNNSNNHTNRNERFYRCTQQIVFLFNFRNFSWVNGCHFCWLSLWISRSWMSFSLILHWSIFHLCAEYQSISFRSFKLDNLHENSIK